MKFSDGWLLLKKILVGIVITVVPLMIIAGSILGHRHQINSPVWAASQIDHGRRGNADLRGYLAATAIVGSSFAV